MGDRRGLIVVILFAIVIAAAIPVTLVLVFVSGWGPHDEKLYSEGTPTCAVIPSASAVFVSVPLTGPGYNFVQSVSAHEESGGGALAFGWLPSGSGFGPTNVRPTTSELQSAVHGRSRGGWKKAAGDFIVKVPFKVQHEHVSLDGVNMVSVTGETLADQDLYFYARADGGNCRASTHTRSIFDHS
jgi:hypothetical protein